MSRQWSAIEDRILSLGEFEGLPESDEERVELIGGRLVREPRPGMEHSWLTGELYVRIRSHALEHGLGLAFVEAGFLLAVDPPTVRGPDVAFIAEENLPAGRIPVGLSRVPPDLSVEVVSPSNTASEIQDKVLEYLAAGTRLVWVVDPRNRSVTAYRSKQDVRVLTIGDTLDGSDVLPGFRLDISDLFDLQSGRD